MSTKTKGSMVESKANNIVLDSDVFVEKKVKPVKTKKEEEVVGRIQKWQNSLRSSNFEAQKPNKKVKKDADTMSTISTASKVSKVSKFSTVSSKVSSAWKPISAK